MNRIRLLPEQVANQIAAGEVIERPASVVKELVENSLDAGATQISAEIQAGGRSLIRVTDNGVGMSRDDALLCLERHATSKIRRAEDLASIGTMGFRGEALPSIASVSRFTLTTRERDSESPEGTQIIISGGKIHEVKAAGTASGTAIEVRQLFFNLPARRKFLRSEETESAHITHYLTLAALAFPQVAFTYQKDSRLVWQLPVIKTADDIDSRLNGLRERLRALYGGEQSLVKVDFSAEILLAGESEEPGGETPRAPFRVWGLIGAPGVSRATREDQHVFVNRRPVENRGINYSLLEGYHTALMKGRYPVCCLFIELDPSAVDVNIHPAKREVKFHREHEVRRLVTHAVREALLAFANRERQAKPGATPTPFVRPAQSENVAPNPQTDSKPPVERVPAVEAALPNFPAELTPVQATPPAAAAQAALKLGFASGSALSGGGVGAHTPGPRAEVSEALRAPKDNAEMRPAQPPAEANRTGMPALQAGTAGPVALLNVPLRILGVVGKLYVVLESDRGLVLLDQHAAHERILFEQMLDRLERHEQASSQRLLLPETVEVSARDAAFLKQQLPVLARLGVGLSEFGERTFLLDALPPFVKVAEPRRFILELVDELKAAGQQVNALRLGEHVVAKTVCRHAVKANDPLADSEVETLVRDLRHCAMPYTCPHGRPTMIEMNFRELEKKFGRVV